MLRSCLLYVLLPVTLSGQWGSAVTVRVAVAPHANTAARYFAELDRGDALVVDRQMLQGDELVFLNVTPGRYTLRIVDSAGTAVSQYAVAAGGQPAPLEVRLPESEAAAPPSGAVPYYRLLHPLDRATKREMLAATRSLDARDIDGAMEHLQKALERNPYIPEAHGWRGALYLRTQNLTKAREELQTAMDQGWKDASLYVNFGLLHLLQHDRESAKAFCRQALGVDPASLAAHKLAELLLHTQ